MKRTFLFLLASLLVTLSSSSAEDDKLAAGFISLNAIPDSEVLDIYKRLAGLELVIDPRVKLFAHPITFRNDGLETKDQIVKLLEKALATQAGVEITRLDDKHASVTYNDALPVTIAFDRVPVHALINNYQQLTGLELVCDSRAKVTRSAITLHSAAPLTKNEAVKLLEQTLLTQAGIVIMRLDDKRASVTYNDALHITH